MIRLKRIGAALVLILLLLLPAGVTQAQPQDLAGHWAEAGILEWLERGWMECCEDGSFNPDAEITRGEFIAYVNWIFGFFDTVQVDFPDLPGDHQYWDEIASGVAAGYLAGYADGTIRPDKPISRLEAAVILAKIAGLTRPEESLPSARFTDAEDIPAWGRDFVEAVAAVGLMQGYEDGSFRPLEHLTRAEVIVLLDKAPGIMEEYMTSPGYLGITPAKADSGSVKELMLYYHLGDIFAGGTVTFHLPPEMVATAGRDMVVISDIDGNSKKIVLEPRHIAKGGQEVTVTGITASEKGVVMLYLAGEEIPEPGYHYFRVTADADGPAGPKGQSYNGWLERIQLFSPIPSGYEGSLAVSPGSARSDSRESLTITYTLGHEFGEGWVEFTLPGEITATPGQDKLVLGGREELLTEAEIRDGGQKVLVRGLTGKKGDELVLTLVDKMIPGPGPYFFSVRADADGEGTGKPATQGTGREFMAFLAYSELDDKGDQINGFIEAMNGGDVEEIAGFLADDVVLVDHHGDGRLVLFTSREDVADEIDNIVNFYYDQVDIDLGSLKALGDNIWSVEGRASEYSARAVASLYPDTGFTGFGCTTITASYAAGAVRGDGYVGGFAGDNSGEITGSYYDRQTTGRSRADNQWGTPKTSAEMKQQATFTDWDFATIWKIKEGSTYPALQWEEQAKGKAEIFTDLGGVPWAKLPIEVLASKDMLKGITGTEYAPNEHITRGDFLYSLVRTLGAAADFTGNFADVKEEAYYYKEIGIARELGMAVGTGENKFDPDASLTRQDMWVLAARGLTQLEKLEGQGTASNLDRFADKDQVADYAVNSIASLVREKLIGVSEDRINPQDKVTRAEAAVFLFQLYIRY